MPRSYTPRLFVLPLTTLLLASGCAAQGYATGYAPEYAGNDYGYDQQGYDQQGYDQQGYDQGYDPNYDQGYDQGYDQSGQAGYDVVQPGDLFGGQNVRSIEVFFEPLAPYGQWVQSRWGRAFAPNVDRDWRPYVNGRWTEDRLWISDDPWGWATDHYGRWGFDQAMGWVWVPGTEWAPHWVAWREANDVTGWAPVPPGISYSIGIGFGSGWGYDNWNSWYAPSWVWVPRTYLYTPRFGGRVLPWRNTVNYWRGSRWQYQSAWRPGTGWYGRQGSGYRIYRPDRERDRVGQVRPGYNPRDRDRPVYQQPRPGSRPDGYVRPSRPSVGGAVGGTIQNNNRPDRQGNWQGRDPRQGQPGGAVSGGIPGRMPGVNPGRLPQANAGRPPEVNTGRPPERNQWQSRGEFQRRDGGMVQQPDRGNMERRAGGEFNRRQGQPPQMQVSPQAAPQAQSRPQPQFQPRPQPPQVQQPQPRPEPQREARAEARSQQREQQRAQRSEDRGNRQQRGDSENRRDRRDN